MDESDIAPIERSEARAVVNASQAGVAENKVLPFRSPFDAASRDALVRTDRGKPRGRSKGRSKS